MFHSTHVLICEHALFRTNASCTYITLGSVANVVVACIELDLTKGNAMQDYTTIFTGKTCI